MPAALVNRASSIRSPVTPAIPSISQHSPVAEALKLTSKGRQKYDPHWHENHFKETVEECTSSPPIRAPPGFNPSSLDVSQTNGWDTDCDNQSDSLLHNPSIHERTTNRGLVNESSRYRESGNYAGPSSPPASPPATSLQPTSPPANKVRSPVVSPTIRRKDIELKRLTKLFDHGIQLAVDDKLKHKVREWSLIQQNAEERALRLRVRQETDTRKRNQARQDQDRQDKAELESAQARQREEEHRLRQNQEAKYREAEAKKRELEQQRHQEILRQLEDLSKYNLLIDNMLEAAEKSFEEFEYKDHLHEMANKGLELLKMISAQATTQLEKAKTEGPTSSDFGSAFRDLLHNASNARNYIQTAFEYARKTGSEDDVKKKEEDARLAAEAARAVQAAQAANAAQARESAPVAESEQPAEGEVVCVPMDAFEEYSKRLLLLATIQEAAKPLSETQDKNVKTFKNDLMKAISTPVNAISSRSGDDLKDKLKRLQKILKGDQFEVSGRRVSIRENKSAMPFVKNLLALKLANQGDEPVSSKHEAAFPIAAIILGIWCTVPDIGQLVLAHLHKVCPYTVPYYIPRTEGQSLEEYNKCLGYKYRDGKPEQQDKFLSRMSGYMRLYASILVTDPPPGANVAHPHGLPHAWQWLCRLINLPPHDDITATLLYDMLQVTGHYLNKSYTKQFHKLLNLILTQFLPKIRAVSARTGPVTRLEICLDKWLKEKRIPPPEGVVTSQFWFTRDDSADYYY